MFEKFPIYLTLLKLCSDQKLFHCECVQYNIRFLVTNQTCLLFSIKYNTIHAIKYNREKHVKKTLHIIVFIKAFVNCCNFISVRFFDENSVARSNEHIARIHFFTFEAGFKMAEWEAFVVKLVSFYQPFWNWNHKQKGFWVFAPYMPI